MKEFYGKSPEGVEAYLYTLENKNGVKVKITNYGATVCSILFPDKNGNFENIALGYKKLEDYISDANPYLGCIAGRFANRIANGKFTLDNVEYSLATNNAPNHLHGGIKGFHRVVWDVTEIKGDDFSGLELKYLSKDGEEGYPGNLNVTVIYKLTAENELNIEYEAQTDKKTIINLTNHSYFNLCGNAKRDVLDHEIKIYANAYTPVNGSLIPTGELKPVDGTPFNFKDFKKIGEEINEAGGYDHNFVLNPGKSLVRKVAEVRENKSGRVLETYTSEPGVQFYTGNFLDGTLTGIEGVKYKKNYGFCLETQHFPDSPNQPEFPSVILNPGDTYTQETIYKFSIME